jgi:heme A synthase
LATALHVLVHHRTKKELIQPAGFLILLVIAQFTLGALTVLSGKHVGVNTSHLAVGALLFVTSVVLTLRVNHTRLTMTSTPETAGFAASTTASSHSSLGANP